jgi:hypothetical protein
MERPFQKRASAFQGEHKQIGQRKNRPKAGLHIREFRTLGPTLWKAEAGAGSMTRTAAATSTQLAPFSLHDVVQVTVVPVMQALHTSTH